MVIRLSVSAKMKTQDTLFFIVDTAIAVDLRLVGGSKDFKRTKTCGKTGGRSRSWFNK